MSNDEDSNVTYIDSYEPDYENPCENCGAIPTVTAVLNGECVHHTGMCGPCTWGEARTLDPSTWNEEVE